MDTQLAASYDHCKQITRQASSSFFHSFLMLPKVKRQAMYALYAFFRQTDDITDDDITKTTQQRQEDVHTWRETLHNALNNNSNHPAMPALMDTIHRFNISQDYLFASIDGVEMDLIKTRYATISELENYCYQVATVVGLSCLHVWGFDDPRAIQHAEHCGLAFQLTNILRDLAEDAQLGRVYLPQEDLDRFGYSIDDLLAAKVNDSFHSLMQFQIQRAQQHYQQAAPLLDYLTGDGRRAFSTMFTTYHDLLQLVKQHQSEIFNRRMRIPSWRKFTIAARCFVMPACRVRHSPLKEAAAS